MAELIAIGYQEEATAQQARDEVSQLTKHPDTARAIIRNGEGAIWVATSPYRLAVGIIWGMFLGLLVDLAAGTGVGVLVGAGLGAAIAKVDRSGIDRKFQGRVRGMLKPGTSSLVVLLVDKGDHGRGRRSPQPPWRYRSGVLPVPGCRVAAPGGPSEADLQLGILARPDRPTGSRHPSSGVRARSSRETDGTLMPRGGAGLPEPRWCTQPSTPRGGCLA